MSIKKLALLAGMAVALVAIAAPTFASAATVWERNHEALDTPETLEFTGHALFTSEFGGVTCNQVDSPTAFSPGSSAVIQQFNATNSTETCEGVGFFEGCEVHNVALENKVGISTTAETNTIAVGAGVLHNTFTNCFIEELDITWDSDDLHLTVDDPTDVQDVTLTENEHEEGDTGPVGHIAGLETAIDVHGDFVLDDETVGIGHE